MSKKTEESYRSTAVDTLMVSIENHRLWLLQFLCIIYQPHVHQLGHDLPSSAVAVAQQRQQSLHNIWRWKRERTQRRSNQNAKAVCNYIREGRKQTFRMTVLLVQLTQLLFLLFGPRWPRSLSDELTVMSYQFPSFFFKKKKILVWQRKKQKTTDPSLL